MKRFSQGWNPVAFHVFRLRCRAGFAAPALTERGGAKAMDYRELLTVAGDFAIAVLLGALVGIEREKRKTEERETEHIAGLRTFILLALLGAAAGWLSRSAEAPWILVAVLLIVGAFVVVGYLATAPASQDGKGLTTEVAAIVVFLLGAMVMLDNQALAIGLGVVTAAVLAYKQPLHGFVAKLGWDDVYAGLRLLIATFIALPLLPNEPIDPWGALNPYSLWLLVILIASLSLVGYVLTRLLGPGKGAAITGLTGGLVSSTAVTLSFAKEARDQPQRAGVLACGILLAWTAMFARVIVEVAVVNRALLGHVLVPLVVMAVVAGGFAAFLYFRGGSERNGAGEGDLLIKNPFSLTAAAKFAVLFAVVLLAVKIVQEHFPPIGLYAIAALAGLTDVDAITLSMAEFAKSGEPRVAVIAIVIAALTNTVVKCAMAVVLAGLSLGKPLIIATAATLLAGLAAAFVF
jgi:uncharacterized membrane protein (DUF4010 family)